MKHSTLVRLLIGAVLSTTIVLAARPPTAVLAQSHTRHAPDRSAVPSTSVTILILDASGSMAANDPNGLRCSAANAFIDLSGQGNSIGVVGLDGTSQKPQQAVAWAQPEDMGTIAARQQLQRTIDTQSQHCRPDGNTPTYDALSLALQMLTRATSNGQIPGSVVLLTDGVPDPNTTVQINMIQTTLLPQYKEHGWVIDTVALGADNAIQNSNMTFHHFLSSLSSATSGKFYDDGHGIVQGISPLNIADFFVDIFARHNHRIVHTDIPPTPLNGTNKQNFSVADYTNNLDVIVVKDQPATHAILRTPNGQVISQSSSGVFVSQSDAHYAIFSIDRPQTGQWELDVTGTGQFLMDSLRISGIGLAPPAIRQAGLAISPLSALALGQPLTVTTNLTNNGQSFIDKRFTLNGTILYTGASGSYTTSFALDDQNTPGTYSGIITVPESAPPGSYEIQIRASVISLDAVVAYQSHTVRIEIFPIPTLVSSSRLPDKQASVIATQWPPALRWLYAFPIWPMQQLGTWALNDDMPGWTKVAGQVVYQQHPYSGARVTATAIDASSKAPVPVTVDNDGNGHFHIMLPITSSGLYTITFKTSGTFEDSHGDFGTTQSALRIVTVPATSEQTWHALLFTVGYLLFLCFLFFFLRFIMLKHPYGTWQCSYEEKIIGSFPFYRASRGPLQWFFSPNLLTSRQAKMPAGLQFRFLWGGIEVRALRKGDSTWQSGNENLPTHFRSASELHYLPSGDEEEHGKTAHNALLQSRDEPRTYLISTQKILHPPDPSEKDEETGTRQYKRWNGRHSDNDWQAERQLHKRIKGRREWSDDE